MKALVFLGLLTSFYALAQSPRTDLAQIDQLIKEFKLTDAQVATESALKNQTKDVELLVRYSRVLVLTGDQEKDSTKQLELYEKARQQAEVAIQLDPKNMMGYLRRAAANGKVALFKGVLQARELVLQTRDDAQKALELNNSTAYASALAHYILGRAHAKLAETPKALRMPLGLAWGNLADAEKHLGQAVQLFGESISFRTDYGKILLKIGKTKEGREQLETALKLPLADPGDPAKKTEAQQALR